MNERHRAKRLTALRYLLALPKSIAFNLRMLPFRQALRLPILVSHHTKLENLSGKITLHANRPRIGLIKIGFNTYQHTDFRYDRTRLNLRGHLVLQGECAIGAGSCLNIGENGTLTFGNQVSIGPKNLIICHLSITFSNHNQTSWCCTLMDTDQHRLIDDHGNCCNPDRPIHLSDCVWLGCHVIATKGTRLAPHTTVGAGSILHGSYDEPHTILAGNPAQVVKQNVVREDYSNCLRTASNVS
ncbi:MAG: hypothetical protein J5641_02970 [Bacteroidales bacterium]|nr:hypothetical protein [Bacteroidales bacterium]